MQVDPHNVKNFDYLYQRRQTPKILETPGVP